MEVEQKVAHERRQLNSLLNSVGGVVASFLTSQSMVPIPTAVPSIRLPSIAPSGTPTPSGSTTTMSPAISSTHQSTMSTTSDASQTTAQPTSSIAPATTSNSSSPSPGLIAGAVIGGVAVLVLLGILIMLILRHKRKKRQTSLPTYHPPTDNNSARSLDETLVDRTPMTERRALASGGYYYRSDGPEKEMYQRQENVAMPQESELYTNANVWELDGRETAVRSELESPMVSPIASPVMRMETPSLRAYAGHDRNEGVGTAKRHEHGELHF